MTIKIIKAGKKQPLNYGAVCDCCECMFTFEKEDIVNEHSYKRVHSVTANCPNCNVLCEVERAQ